MSGPRRLAVFASVVWLLFWLVGYLIDGDVNWTGFFTLAVVPLVLAWGVWWVVAGFRQKRT